MKRILWPLLVAVLFLIAGAFWINTADLSPYWDLPSFGMTFGLTFLVLLAAFRPGEIRGAFAAAMAGRDVTPNELEKALVFFQTARRLLLASGILGSVIGVVAILSREKDPGKMLAGFAMCLLTVVYALIGIFVLILPCEASLKARRSGRS